jgi:multidrug efflux pump subunit AcrB
MKGVPKAMFLPLSLSVGFAMLASYALAQSLVPVLTIWILKEDKFRSGHGKIHAHAEEAMDKMEIQEVADHQEEQKEHPENNDFFQRLKQSFMNRLFKMHQKRSLIITLYLSVVMILAGLCFTFIGKDMLPKVNTGQFQIRIKAPEGTRLERTEEKLKQIIDIIDTTVNHHVEITSAFVGLVPSSFGTSNLYVFNSGTHEAVLQVSLNEKYHYLMDDLKDVIRKNIKKRLPDINISFEPIELTEKIMGQGALAPIEIRVAGKNFADIESWSKKLLKKLKEVPYLRDIQIQQPLAFPTIEIKLDRFKLKLFGLTVSQVSNSVTASTTSSRFVDKNLWLDENNAYTYQVQVQVPERRMNALDDLKEIPLFKGRDRPILADVAEFNIKVSPGEYDRVGPRRFLTVSANLYKKDLSGASTDVQKIINSLGSPPKGLITEMAGMSGLLTETLDSLQTGLVFAILVILLLLAANYESLKLGLAVLTTVPAVLLGSLTMLLISGDTLNLESYMGIIMSIGVSVANAILIVTNAEVLRLQYKDTQKASITAAGMRLRPILMTSMAMIAGMIPMALGMGEAGEQTAPLGRAVIGGLAASIFAALFILPLIFTWVQGNAGYKEKSLMPK